MDATRCSEMQDRSPFCCICRQYDKIFVVNLRISNHGRQSMIFGYYHNLARKDSTSGSDPWQKIQIDAHVRLVSVCCVYFTTLT